MEVAINHYPTRELFAQALVAFGRMVERVDLLSELAGENEAMLLYDATVAGLGQMRIVEHFTLNSGRIARLRQIHDTAAIRGADLKPWENLSVSPVECNFQLRPSKPERHTQRSCGVSLTNRASPFPPTSAASSAATR